jgi:hypothetical protein
MVVASPAMLWTNAAVVAMMPAMRSGMLTRAGPFVRRALMASR